MAVLPLVAHQVTVLLGGGSQDDAIAPDNEER
jgi:hypothetical protein